MTQKQPLTQYLSTKQVADFLSICEVYARELMRTGKIRATNRGRWRTTEADLIAYVEGSR